MGSSLHRPAGRRDCAERERLPSVHTSERPAGEAAAPVARCPVLVGRVRKEEVEAIGALAVWCVACAADASAAIESGSTLKGETRWHHLMNQSQHPRKNELFRWVGKPPFPSDHSPPHSSQST